MEYLIQNYNIREITFQDDVFTMDTNRTEDICKLIIEKKLDITWSCNTRVNLVSEGLLKLMKDVYLNFPLTNPKATLKAISEMKPSSIVPIIRRIIGLVRLRK